MDVKPLFPILALLRRATQRLWWEPLRGALLPMEGLSLSHKLLSGLGYLTIFGLLGGLLLVELLGTHLPLVTFVSAGKTQQVPAPVLAICAIGFVLGWAFLMTGATDCHRRIFLPLALLFGINLFFLLPQNRLVLLWCLTVPLMLGGLVAFYLATARHRYWRELALVEWIGLAGALFAITLLTWVDDSLSQVAEAMAALFNLLMLAVVPFWFFSGLAVVDWAVSVGESVAGAAQRRLPPPLLNALALFLILSRPALGLLAIPFGKGGTLLANTLIFDMLFSLPLIGVSLLLLARRRWQGGAPRAMLTLTLTTPFLSLAFFASLQGMDLSDTMGTTLEQVPVFPPLLLFVALMAHGVLSEGAEFASTDGRLMPRSGRILLGFGYALLVTTFTFFFINVRDITTGEPLQVVQLLVENLFLLSLAFLGIPYLLWLILRRRERFVGQAPPAPAPMPPALASVTANGWLMLAGVLALLLFWLACAGGAWLTTLAQPPQ